MAANQVLDHDPNLKGFVLDFKPGARSVNGLATKRTPPFPVLPHKCAKIVGKKLLVGG